MAHRAPLAFLPSRRAGLIALGSLLALGAALPDPARANFAYGIDDQQRIREVNLTKLTSGIVTDAVLFDGASIICAGLSGANLTYCNGTAGTDGQRQAYYSNSFALDKVRRQFYFLDYQGNLRYWDFNPATGLPVLAPQSQNGLINTSTRTAFTANASFYNDAYWYFISNTACDATQPTTSGVCDPGTESPDRGKLVKYSLTYDINGKPTTVGSATTYTVPNLPSGVVLATGSGKDFTFGDIAIDSDGTLYGATVAGGFYTLDLSSCSGSSCGNATILRQNNSTTPLPAGVNPSLQIAFDSDFSDLYGTTFGSAAGGIAAGGWGILNPGDGGYTQLFANAGSTVTPLRDISALSSSTNAVPGPLPLLGAGAAFGWTRRLRRRLGRAQALVSPR